MPKWLSPVLLRIHELALQGFVRFTHKANEELKALGLVLRTSCIVLSFREEQSHEDEHD